MSGTPGEFFFGSSAGFQSVAIDRLPGKQTTTPPTDASTLTAASLLIHRLAYVGGRVGAGWVWGGVIDEVVTTVQAAQHFHLVFHSFIWNGEMSGDWTLLGPNFIGFAYDECTCVYMDHIVSFFLLTE